MDPEVTTILDPLRANTEKHPDKLLFAFLDSDGRPSESYRYEEFLQRTTDIASHIHRTQRLEPGERVLLCYPPGVEMICAFFACMRLGLIPVPVYPPSSQGFEASLYRMNFIARDCRAAAVLTDRGYFWSMKLHKTRARITSFSFRQDYTSRIKWMVTSDAEPNARADFREARSELAFLQYTSGSTSDPRGVMVTHHNVASSCEAICDHCPTGVSWLPQYHDLGLIAFYIFPAIKGGTTYGFSPIDFIQRPSLWLETISRYRATASAAPNFAFEYCLRPDKVDVESLAKLDLSSLRLLWSGAEPVRANVFRSFFRKLEPCGLHARSYGAAYGLAEYTLAVCGHGSTIGSFDAERIAENEVSVATPLTPAAGVARLVSCGRPLGAAEIKIIDISGPPREAPPERVGEIWVTGPSKCLGYWDRPELSRQIFGAQLEEGGDSSKQWLRTGDLGFIRDGELFVCGRAKDLIIVRGLNYYPQDIEAVVEEDPAIRKGCVAAFAVEEAGDEVLVVVAELKNPRRRPETERINRRIRQRLGVVANSFVLIRPRTIPKTSSGKIVRHETRTRWREDRLETVTQTKADSPAVAMPGDQTRGVMMRGNAPYDGRHVGLANIFRDYGLTGAENLTLGEVGLDSLRIAELAFDIENHLKGRGAEDLAAAVDIRWLQKIVISELFELLHQVNIASPNAAFRFRRAFAALRRENQEVERNMMRRDSLGGFDASGLRLVEPDSHSTSGGVLLTGGTGFFGPFLLTSLLEQCEDEIYVVVRAPDADHANRRLREAIDSLDVPWISRLWEGWRRRVRPICGDLTRPSLGVSPSDWAFLTENVHTIYHNGALVNYLLDYATMRAANVGSTNELLRLAVTGRTKTLNHISTTFVFGWSTKDTLFESDSNEEMELLDFGYSQSKWVSEQIVLRAMRQGLPARVFRPALIAPSVGGGGYNFDIAVRLLAFILKYGVSTTAKNQVSFTPADLVANNIVAISNLPESVGKTFHVTRDTYSSMLDITDILGELTGTRFENYALQDFVPVVIGRCATDDLLFPLLNFLVRSVDNITAMEFKRYDNRNYRQARAASPFGKEDPPLEDVVSGIVRFMRRHGVADSRDAGLLLERV